MFAARAAAVQALLLALLLLALAPAAAPPPPPAAGAVLGLDWRPAAPAAPRRRLLAGGRANATLPLAGAVKDLGYFAAALYVGTPPRRYALIVDTGSTMTYVACAACEHCGRHEDPAYNPAASATSAPVGCGAPGCACGSPPCGCGPGGRCTYTRTYAEKSSSSGTLVRDVVWLAQAAGGGGGAPAGGGDPSGGGAAQQPQPVLAPSPIVFGCESRETGEIYKQRADGLLGLGRSPSAVVDQLAARGALADGFALCLGGVEGGGALVLGAPPPGAAAAPPQYTPLLRSRAAPFYYNVGLEGVDVGGAPLDVDAAVWGGGYGAVLDSGTTFAYLPTPAYAALAAAVDAAALGAGLARVPPPDPGFDSDRCYGGAPADHADAAGLAAVFPRLGLRLRGGARLDLPPLNYLFVHTFGSGKYCLGVFDNGAAGVLLGGILFRDTLVEYDRAAERVGFAPAACAAMGAAARPPCAAFGAAAAAAAAAGDCADAAPAADAAAAAGGEEGGGDGDAQPAPADGDGVDEDGADAAAEAALPGGLDALPAAAPPPAPPAPAMRVGAGALGALAAVVVGLSAALAAALARRSRGRHRYRPLQEGGGPDAEAGGGGGASVGAAAAVPMLVAPAPAVGSGAAVGVAAPGAQREVRVLREPQRSAQKLELAMTARHGGAQDVAKRLGLTSPQKLVRTGSNPQQAAAVAAELQAKAAAGVGGGTRPGTPRT